MCITQYDILDFIKSKGKVERNEIFDFFGFIEKGNAYRKLKQLRLHQAINIFQDGNKVMVEAT